MIKKTFFSLITLLVVIMTLTHVLDNFNTANASSIDRVTYYRSVKVSKGDTLWGIAIDNYQEGAMSIELYIDEVKYINNLKNDTIQAGDYIIVPYQVSSESSD